MRMEVILTEEGSRGCTMPAIPDDESWAGTEFADAELGDARRARRLVTLATVLAQRPAASLPEACGTPAMLKAAYRFFDNEAIDPQEMVASHVGATSARLAAVPVVLAVQDTTELDWTAHPATRGLGPLAHPAHQGLLVHTTLALTPERLPLGLLAQQVWARDPADRGKRVSRKRRPVAEKESQKWLTSVEAVSAARARCPQTHFVCVGDREADVYDLFLQERPAGVDLLVRAAWNRRVDHAERALWAKVAAHPVVATLTMQIPPGHGERAVVSGAVVPAQASPGREAAHGGGLGCPGRGGAAPGRLCAAGVAAVDHLWGAHRPGRRRAGGLVCLSLGH
jgi:hypothetical protein